MYALFGSNMVHHRYTVIDLGQRSFVDSSTGHVTLSLPQLYLAATITSSQLRFHPLSPSPLPHPFSPPSHLSLLLSLSSSLLCLLKWLICHTEVNWNTLQPELIDRSR